MGEIFLRSFELEAVREGPWLTVCIDLRSGMDLSNIDVASMRLNDCADVGAHEVRDDVLYLSFRYRDVRAFVGRPQALCLTGRFSDGVGLRGSIAALRCAQGGLCC